jgi:membrane associated rhomboid family serine protease
VNSLLDRPDAITFLLIAVNVAVSLVGFYLLSREQYRHYVLFIPYRTARGENWIGALLSHVAHGDIGHLLLNMLALFFFGPVVEATLGGARYLIVYVVSGLLATLTVFLARKNNPRYAALGASGSIAGIVFASVVIDPTSSVYLMFMPIRVPAPIFAVLYLAFSSINMGGRDGVAHEAHIGGAIAGFVITGFLYQQHFQPFIDAVTHLLS